MAFFSCLRSPVPLVTFTRREGPQRSIFFAGGGVGRGGGRSSFFFSLRPAAIFLFAGGRTPPSLRRALPVVRRSVVVRGDLRRPDQGLPDGPRDAAPQECGGNEKYHNIYFQPLKLLLLKIKMLQQLHFHVITICIFLDYPDPSKNIRDSADEVHLLGPAERAAHRPEPPRSCP